MGKICPATWKCEVWVKYFTCANFSTSSFGIFSLCLSHLTVCSDCLVHSLSVSQLASFMFFVFSFSVFFRDLFVAFDEKKIQHKIMKQKVSTPPVQTGCVYVWIEYLNTNKVFPYIKGIILRTSVTSFLSLFDSFSFHSLFHLLLLFVFVSYRHFSCSHTHLCCQFGLDSVRC